MKPDYPTKLTDNQWQVIKNIITPQERTRKYSLREIMNALLYINKTGCQWRMLPLDFAPWQNDNQRNIVLDIDRRDLNAAQKGK